jgi:hypothetical protein
VEIVYLIVSTPDAIPVTTPELFTVASEVNTLLHVPPEVVSVRVILEPTHTEFGPVIVPALVGVLPTVIVLVAFVVPQTLVFEYVMTAVPGLTPVTTPVLLILATAVLLLLQVPSVAVSVSKMVEPVQTNERPEMALSTGAVFTVTSVPTDVSVQPNDVVTVTLYVPEVVAV